MIQYNEIFSLKDSPSSHAMDTARTRVEVSWQWVAGPQLGVGRGG
jgi:hypothetical protein